MPINRSPRTGPHPINKLKKGQVGEWLLLCCSKSRMPSAVAWLCLERCLSHVSACARLLFLPISSSACDSVLFFYRRLLLSTRCAWLCICRSLVCMALFLNACFTMLALSSLLASSVLSYYKHPSVPQLSAFTTACEPLKIIAAKQSSKDNSTRS